MEEAITREDLWHLLEAFIKDEGLVKQHLNSYDYFIEHGLQKIVDEVGEVEIEAETRYKIRFGKIEVGAPRVVEVDGSEHEILPMEARLRNLTYAAPIYLEMWIERDGRKVTLPEPIYIGDIPIMVRSKKCKTYGMSPEELVEVGEDPKDPGGYFIINGSERVVVALEDLAPEGLVKVEGEVWRAICEEGGVKKGRKVVVTGWTGIKLVVEEVEEDGG